MMNANTVAKLNALKNRSTKYEMLLVHPDGRKALLCYSGKTWRRVNTYIGDHAQAVVKFCGSEQLRTATTQADFAVATAAGIVGFAVYGAIGEWRIVGTMRTQREAICAGEVAWFKAEGK
jgi:hypothetical protein